MAVRRIPPRHPRSPRKWQPGAPRTASARPSSAARLPGRPSGGHHQPARFGSGKTARHWCRLRARPQRVWGTRVGAVRTGAAVLLSTRCRAVDGRHRVDRGPPASHCRQPAGAGAGTPKARGHAHAASVRTVASKRRRPFAPRTHPARGQHLPRRLLLTPNFPKFFTPGKTVSNRAARWNSLSIFIHLRWNSIISFGFPPVAPLDSAPDEVSVQGGLIFIFTSTVACR